MNNTLSISKKWKWLVFDGSGLMTLYSARPVYLSAEKKWVSPEISIDVPPGLFRISRKDKNALYRAYVNDNNTYDFEYWECKQ